MKYKLEIEYDGTDFVGWQLQDNGVSVQGCIEQAIHQLSGENARLYCAGRTDSGVHAIAQTAHFELDKEFSEFSIMQGINHHLAEKPISIVKAEIANDDFHARFSAKKRYYIYRIINRKSKLAIEKNRAWQYHINLDVVAMNKAAQTLIGKHDFSTFRDSKCQAKSPIKTIDKIEIKQISNPYGKEVHIYISAKSFLHHQVRNITGSLILVGNGKWSVDDFVLARDAHDRRKGGQTAPACGLYFLSVDY